MTGPHRTRRLQVLLVACLSTGMPAADSLPPLVAGRAPANVDELWAGYDPRKEPVDVQVVREWTEGSTTLRHVVFTVGTFRGRVSRLAGLYGFPTGGTGLPAILEIHGGGGRATLGPVRSAAADGYACLSINWNGKPMEGMEEGAANTAWGAIDPSQNHNDHYYAMTPDPLTVDQVVSPRNNNWFLLVLAARRALTFLEQQPEVDGHRLGVTGHSMGGKITTDLAGIDPRVRAAVPSCGGAGSVGGKLSGMPGAARPNQDHLAMATVEDEAYLPRITCPILFQSPTNDFAAPFDHMTVNWPRIPAATPVARAVSTHLNHFHAEEALLTGRLWFDQHLKQSCTLPANPRLEVDLAGPGGIPRATVTVDRPGEVVRVDIRYAIDPSCIFRFWRDAQATGAGAVWTAACPVLDLDQPLFVYANVTYRLARPRPGGGTDYLLSSREAIHTPADLRAAGVRATDRPSRQIDDFARGWQDWGRIGWPNPHWWLALTRKLKDPKWHGPAGARLVWEVRCPRDCVLAVEANVNEWNVYPGKPGGVFRHYRPLSGSPDWQTIALSLADLRPEQGGQPGMPGWDTITTFSFRWAKTYPRDGQDIPFGDGVTGWPASERQFRNLHWEGGDYAGPPADLSTVGVPVDLDKTIQGEIRKSQGQEHR